MKKNYSVLVVLFAVISLVFSAPAFAKKEGKSPLGWLKGEKKGWDGGQTPPGLSKADAKKAEKEAKQKQKEVEREAKKKQKEADREAKKKQKEAEKAAKQAKESLEKAAS